MTGSADDPGFDARGSFAFGSIRGVRAFATREDGWLTSLVFPSAVWSPGLNEARCLRRGRVCGFQPDAGDHMHDRGCMGVVPCPRTPGTRKEGPDWCKCGFYGYQEGSLDTLALDHTGGVIEGSGRVRIGDHGFRAQKARILAIYVPPQFIGLAKHMQLGYSYGVPMVAIARTSPLLAQAPTVSRFRPELVRAIAHRYPGTPIYRDLNAMVADFPPDPPRKEQQP